MFVLFWHGVLNYLQFSDQCKDSNEKNTWTKQDRLHFFTQYKSVNTVFVFQVHVHLFWNLLTKSTDTFK